MGLLALLARTRPGLPGSGFPGEVPITDTPAGGTLIGYGSSSMWYMAKDNLAPLTGTGGLWNDLIRHGYSGYKIEQISPKMFDAAPEDVSVYKQATTLLWSGKNNMFRAGEADHVISLTDQMFDWLDEPRHALVLGHFLDQGQAGQVSDENIRITNEAHAKRYGPLFIDVQAYVSGEQIWHDVGIAPTAADLAYQAKGEIPPSLARDPKHLTFAAYGAIADLVVARMRALGWY